MTKKVASRRRVREMAPQLLTLPASSAAAVITAFAGHITQDDVDFIDTMREVGAQADAIVAGDDGMVQRMLVGQAVALQTLFASLAKRASIQERVDFRATLLGLALRSQRQCAATLGVLAEVRSPRTTAFIKQGAVGVQQVNVGRTPELPAAAPTELLGVEHGERVDAGTAGGAARGDPALAAVGKLDGSADGGG